MTVRTNSLNALTTFQNQLDASTWFVMPGMTGRGLAMRILQIRPDMPIIICARHSSQITENEARAYGIKRFAFKPLARKDIAVLIRKILDEGKNIS